MDTNNVRNWVVLSWNVRGVNATWKWDAVKNKILQSAYDIVCLQETKKEMFDLHFLKMSILVVSIVLSTSLLWELLVGSWLHGKYHSFLEPKFTVTVIA
jgi:hypothetical protein